MYTNIERTIVRQFTAAVPPLQREQRAQFAMSLPMLALLSVVLVGLLGGWLRALISVVQSLLISPALIVALLLTPLFWIEILPPILWALSFFPLRERRLRGWRLFVAGTILSFIGSLLSLQVIGILFGAAILYFTLQCYDEFAWRS